MQLDVHSIISNNQFKMALQTNNIAKKYNVIKQKICKCNKNAQLIIQWGKHL